MESNKKISKLLLKTWLLLIIIVSLLNLKTDKMEYFKYQHIEKVGTTEVEGIEIGTCYIFPKIDGTNSQLWWSEPDGLKAGSRNRELSLDNDNAGFYNWAVTQPKFYDVFKKYPDLKLFGEWLVPHTLKTYRDDAWRRFYVFDAFIGNISLSYEQYKQICDEFEIDCIPPLAVIKNPTYERLIELLDKNIYLIKDNEGVGEGIVVKNYDYKNKYGRQTWAKIVRNEFKEKHWGNQPTEVKERKLVEQEIVDKYVTLSLVEKEYAKIVNECGWTSKMIPRLLNTVYYSLVKEECWNFVKEFKNPSIDFKRMMFMCNIRIKQLMPQLF